MAECFDEFDEATPLKRTFCSRVSLEEYEQQTADTTEEAIAQLIAHLDNSPQSYYRVLQAKKDEDVSVFSYIKVLTHTSIISSYEKVKFITKLDTRIQFYRSTLLCHIP